MNTTSIAYLYFLSLSKMGQRISLLFYIVCSGFFFNWASCSINIKCLLYTYHQLFFPVCQQFSSPCFPSGFVVFSNSRASHNWRRKWHWLKMKIILIMAQLKFHFLPLKYLPKNKIVVRAYKDINGVKFPSYLIYLMDW